ncbi:MAG TPA: hypothetical protein VNC50_03315, partial [Planctomycetia bacterium]|nr:hypothetical protein [Planctomycetia bacterium]
AEDEFSLGRLLVAARDRERGEASLRAALDAVAGMAKSEKSLGLAARIRTSLVSLCVAREDLESAVLHARAAVDAREELLKTAPKSAASRRSLALEQGNLASILGNLGRVEEAASLYRSCLASLESLANENPSAPEFRHAAATFGLNFARFLGARGRQKEEFERTERSVEILARLRADFPAAIDYAIDLGGARSNQSQTFRRRGDPGRALESLNAAVSDLDAALKIQPDHARARRYLKTACVARALAHESRADHKAARADWLRAVELARPDAAPDFRSAAALALARSGDPEAALREVADLAGSPEPAPLACRDLAALLVLAAEKSPPAAQNERLDRAAAFVRRLLKAGVTREQFLQHPELAPLLKQIDRKTDL